MFCNWVIFYLDDKFADFEVSQIVKHLERDPFSNLSRCAWSLVSF